MRKVLVSLSALLCFILNAHSQIYYDNWPVELETNSVDDIQDSGIVAPQCVLIGTQGDHRIITYFFENGTASINLNGEHQAVRDAFSLWAAATDLVFLEACSDCSST